ncbi:MAG: GNAT family N-acetyltransferase [Phycisphaerales bacterium]|nr:MAG: GNAT family N-acetyltransferase [Phycisphaerales bacterium]
MEIRRVRANDGVLLRGVHLRMLADAPDAFSETLAEAQAMSAAQWDARAERFGSGAKAVAFVALEAGEVVGFVAGFVGRFREKAMQWDVSDTVTLARAWVATEMRQQGIGRALAKSVEAWAAEKGAAVLEAQVTENNEAAIRFYAKLGFADKGQREPLRSNPALQIRFLSQRLR